ncbi:MAG: hypothetical protein KAS72_08270 [Phycisphaerales bacterium]|nr:hypothetical protein [Phycisphaerales bacterium]
MSTIPDNQTDPEAALAPTMDRASIAYASAYADFHLLTAALFLGCIVLAPAWFPELLGEDGCVEIPTTVMAAAGAVLAVMGAVAAKNARRLRAKCLIFALFFAFIVGEENDWGIRLFVKKNMVAVGDGPNPREVNLNTLHELICEVGLQSGADTAYRIAAIVAIVVLVGLFLFAVIRGGVRLWPFNRSVWDRAQRLTLVGAILMALGQLRDLGITPIIKGLGSKFPEEILEFYAAACWLFAGWSLYLAAKGIAGAARPPNRGIWGKLHWFLTAPP